ncbi:hypothetical protein A3780_00975 [Kosakonia radicincitans]|nr:hypothetical protein A3780_00975 [Kosakonia radicincitans]
MAPAQNVEAAPWVCHRARQQQRDPEYGLEIIVPQQHTDAAQNPNAFGYTDKYRKACEYGFPAPFP